MGVCVLRDGAVNQCPADAAVAVFKGVNALKPQVGNGGAGQAVKFGRFARLRRCAVEPLNEAAHFLGYLGRGRCLVMHHLTAGQAADDLHRVCVVAVAACGDAPDVRCVALKKGCLPEAQALVVQGGLRHRYRVAQHINQAIYRTVWPQGRCLFAGQAELAQHGGAHTGNVQALAFNGGSGQRLLRQGFVGQRET